MPVRKTGDESTMLFGLSPNDLPNIAGVSLLLLVVALFTSPHAVLPSSTEWSRCALNDK
jgi:hypothetical protein